MNTLLTEDTKVILLLCGVLGTDKAVSPLTLREYNKMVQWLQQQGLRPADLLEANHVEKVAAETDLPFDRLKGLLARGVQLGFAVEEWQRTGIWLLSRSDTDYPVRLKRHLKGTAPALLFGAGNRALLQGGGVGIVGSRNVDEAGQDFTLQAAEQCACNGLSVVSGGARGVDQIAMNAALEAGGVVVGVLADSLLKTSLQKSTRKAIASEQLLLISPYHPGARFTVGTAMGRNKLIYAMADYGLVVSADYKKGGTWTGAEEELKRKNSRPVFVRIGEDLPKGNEKLIEMGAMAWPKFNGSNELRATLNQCAVIEKDRQKRGDLTLFDLPPAADTPAPKPFKEKVFEVPASYRVPSEGIPETVYGAVLPLILNRLEEPFTGEALAEVLEVNKTQLNIWLKKAVAEKKLKKLTGPVRYQRIS